MSGVRCTSSRWTYRRDGTLRLPQQIYSIQYTVPSAASFYVPTLPGLQRGPVHPLHMYAGHIVSDPNVTTADPLDVLSHLFFVPVKASWSVDKEGLMFWFTVCLFFRVGVSALTMTFQGGPGYSSFDGLLMEIGPWRMDEEGMPRTVGGWEEYMTMVYGMFQVSVAFPQLHLLWIINRPACWYKLIIYQYESLCAV